MTEPQGDRLVSSNIERKTVLLVDDEEAILEIGQLMLEHSGYKVITAADGKKAIENYEVNLPVDVVVLDLSLPGMSGKQILEGILAINPEQKIIISSGYDIGDTAEELLMMGADDFLPKPFHIEMLSKKIEELLTNAKIVDREKRKRRVGEIVAKVKKTY